MKVGFVLGTTAGGTGRHVRMLADGCAACGVPTVVFAPGQAVRDLSPGAAGSAGTDCPEAGVTWQRVEFGDRPHVLRDGRAVLRLRRLFARSGADIVHAHGMRAGALAAIALAFAPRARPPWLSRQGGRPARGEPAGQERPAGKEEPSGAGKPSVSSRPGGGRLPLVVTVHNAPPSSGMTGAVYGVLELIVARNADEVLCVSADLEARMRQAGAGHTGRALVPAPGPDAAGVPAEGIAAVREELGAGGIGRLGATDDGVSARRPVVLAAGRLAPQKGFAVLLEAAARWRDADPMPVLAIAGEGPLAEQLAASAAPLGRAVRFLGRRDDMPVLLAAADVVVVPSLWEGQPLFVQEALRAGRPVVASRAGGIPDLTGEDAAVLVPPGDPERLARAVRGVLADPALAARLGRSARDRARRLPSEGDAVEAALACYRRVLARRQPAG